MKIDFKTCSEEELWKYIALNLSKNDVDVILVGGAVVSIYSEGAYRSGDLDFVLNDFSRKKLEEVLIFIYFNGHPFKQHNGFVQHTLSDSYIQVKNAVS